MTNTDKDPALRLLELGYEYFEYRNAEVALANWGGTDKRPPEQIAAEYAEVMREVLTPPANPS